jgi:hypothetical protein
MVLPIGASMDSKHIDGCLCYWCNEHRALDTKRQTAEAMKEVQERAAHADDCFCYKCVDIREKAFKPDSRLEDLDHSTMVQFRDTFTEDSIYWWQWNCGIHNLSARQYREQMVKAQDELSLVRRLNQQRKEEAATKETEAANSLQAEIVSLQQQLEAAKRETQIYQGNALYWKAQYDQAVAEQDSADDDELHKLTITCHVLARMLASAYDTE